MTTVDPTLDSAQQNGHARWCQITSESPTAGHACFGADRHFEVLHPLTGEMQDLSTGVVRQPDGATYIEFADPVTMSVGEARTVAGWLVHMADVADGVRG